MTYPSGRVLNTSYDSAGRANGLTGSIAAETFTYAGGITYAPHGAMTALSSGPSGAEKINRAFGYDQRLRMTSANAGNNTSSSNLMALTYGYAGNGNVTSSTIARDGGFAASQTFGYDGVNRLRTASEANGGTTHWAQTYAYDNLGNRALVANGTPANSYVASAAELTPTVASESATAVAALFPNNRWAAVATATDAAGYVNRHRDPRHGV